MAYGIKYTQSIFVPVYNSTTNSYANSTVIVNAKLNGYTGSSTSIKYYDSSALVLTYDSTDKDSFDMPVHGSSMAWNVYVDKNATGITEIAESNYKDWLIEVSGSSGFYWLGYFQPDNYTSSFLLPYNYVLNLTATDGLANLKNIDYSGHTSGTVSVVQAVKYALDQIGLGLPIVDQVNWTEHFVTSTPILNNILIHLERFKSTSNGVTTFTNSYDTIGYILEPFNAILSQENGKWLIQQKNESASKRHTYNSTLSSATTVNYDRSVDISSNYFYPDADELSKILPTQKQTTTLQDGILSTGTNLIGNPAGTYFFNTGSTAFDAIGAQPETVVTAQENATPNSTHDFTTYINIVHLSTGNTLQLKVFCSPSVGFISGSAYPYFLFRLQAPNGTITDDPFGQRVTHPSGDTFTSTSFTITTSGKYKLIFRVIPNAASNYLSWNIFFNTFQANIFYQSKAVTDKLFVTRNLTTNNSLGLKENTILYSDAETQDNYGALLANTKTGLTCTSSWSSYEAATGKKSFVNGNFLSNTFQWSQMNNPALGTGITWIYDKLSGWASCLNSGTGFTFTKVLYQTGYTSGLYNVTFSVQNESTVTSGTNPNIDFGIWISSGGTLARINTQVYLLNSTTGFFNKLFIFNVPVNNAIIGFDMYRFGAGSDVKVWINQATINSYSAPDYLQPHYNLYNYEKIRKRYRYADYIKLKTYLNQNIYFNSIIVMNGVKYEIAGYSYDIVNNNIEFDLAEFSTNDSLVSVVNTETILPTINGN